MDNASKALIMAGGVLLAILIISVALYLFAGIRGFAKAQNTNAEVSAVESFNRYYQSFDSKITGIDVVNICNKITNDRENGHDIECNARNSGLYASLNSQADDAIKYGTDKIDLRSKKYSFSITKYDTDGYISYISIN